MFAFRDEAGGVRRVGVAVTDVTLDLADRDGGEPLRTGLAILAERLGVHPVVMRQVHGATVARITEPTPPADAPVADALVTTRPGVALLARAADCAPVLLADPQAGVVGAAHAGRPGLAAGVVPALVGAMRDLGARDLVGWIGPHVCGGCYEVPAAMRDEVAAAVPASFAETRWGTPSLDLGAGVAAQLEEYAVRVRTVDRCTREDPALPSYRRDGAAAGRCAGMIWLVPS